MTRLTTQSGRGQKFSPVYREETEGNRVWSVTLLMYLDNFYKLFESHFIISFDLPLSPESVANITTVHTAKNKYNNCTERQEIYYMYRESEGVKYHAS